MAARDAAIRALRYGPGLRRAEAVGLEVADYDRKASTFIGSRNYPLAAAAANHAARAAGSAIVADCEARPLTPTSSS